MWPRFPAGCRRSASLEAMQGVTLRKTHKFLCAWKIKELHEPKVVSRDNVQASVGHTRAVDISLVCVSRPDANDFVSQNAVPTGRGVRWVRRLRAVRHPLPGMRGKFSVVTRLLWQEGTCPLPLCIPAPATTILCPSPFHPKKKSYLRL